MYFKYVAPYLDKMKFLNCEAAKRSAGLALKMTQRNPLHTGDKTRKRGIHPHFETQDRPHQKCKTGVSVVFHKNV